MAEVSSSEMTASYGDQKLAKEYNVTNAGHSASPIGDYRPGSDEEKKLLRKLDTRIIVRSPNRDILTTPNLSPALCLAAVSSGVLGSSEYRV
jgi:hypothetical protein